MSNITRQQLYDRIRETSRDEFILSEMIRLGFWNEQEGTPSLPAQLIQEKGELERQLNELFKKQRIYADPQKALKEMHIQRKKEAKLKREATKKEHNRLRHERANKRHQTYLTKITDLGPGVSKTLGDHTTDLEKLEEFELPPLSTDQEIASAMGITIHELRFLTYSRSVSKVSHYQQFMIAKKSGGFRKISAPMPRLKRLQYWILGNILEEIILHEAAHGFIANHSILTNAKPHTNKKVVINMDLKNFFPTLTYKRIRGVFRSLGYSNHAATIFGLITTSPEHDPVELDGATYYVRRGERHLPQGAPSSPALTNIICRKLDKRLEGLAQKLNFTYTRYADDLTFSSNYRDLTQRLLWSVKKIVTDEGFTLHPDKTRVMHSGRKQEVTGIVVNQKCSIDRKKLKQFRALLFQIERDGLRGKKWGSGPLLPAIEGYANFVAMVKPDQGKRFQDQVKAIRYNFGHQTSVTHLKPLNRIRFKELAIEGKAPRTDWWTATPKAAPIVEETAQEVLEQRQVQQQATQQTTTTTTPSPNSSGTQNRQNRQNSTSQSSKDRYKSFFKRD